MGADRRKRILLGALIVALLVLMTRPWWSASEVFLPSSNGRAGTSSTDQRRSAPGTTDAPQVHLDALAAAPSPPADTKRNLFLFKPKAPPPSPASSAGARAGAAAPPVPTGPQPPAPPPPIALKFIGIVAVTDKSRFAVLSDGRGGPPFSGREGDIIEGRYRILRIGSESIEMAYLDGRGRQTIRLSGS